MSNSNQDQNPNSNSNPRRHPRLQTSQSLFTITGHELVASPTNTDFAESSPNPDSADSHHITFPDFPAEGGRYAEFDMAGTMLSLGSDPSMNSFGSGSVFPTIPESHPGCMSQAARVQPMFPESDENGPRQMTRHGQPVRGIVQSMDMNTRSTARPGRRFGSVVLHDPRMSSGHMVDEADYM